MVRGARELGAEVQHLHTVGQGCPDLLIAFRGRWYVVEVKAEDGKLTPDEEDWHERFSRQAPIEVWRDWDDVVRTLLGNEDGN